jgi:hypothetical protein
MNLGGAMPRQVKKRRMRMDLGHEARDGSVRCSYCGRTVRDFKTVLRDSHRLLDHFGIEPVEPPPSVQQR